MRAQKSNKKVVFNRNKIPFMVNMVKQAGAKLGQAQVKLEVVDEDLAKA